MNDVITLAKKLEASALADLTRLVNNNSFTQNPEGLIRTGDMIRDIAADRGIVLDKVPFKEDPDGAFHLTCDMADGRPFIGLVGHFDTVHPPESPFSALEDRGDILTGPGVQDMKSGIITAIYGLHIAATVLKQERLPVKIVFNADEETGSKDSRALIEGVMNGADAALILEGHKLSENALVTSRKGIMMGQMQVTGQAAHAGEEPEQGASAIVEAAHKIAALDRLTDAGRGILVTTGVIRGGQVANQVPDQCRSSIDIRFTTKAQEAEIQAAVQKIMAGVHVPGTTTQCTLTTARPPFEEAPGNLALYKDYAEAASTLGLSLGASHRGGGSDGNFTAAMGIPTLDGMGPAGDFPHTDREYIDKASFLNAIILLARLLVQRLNPNFSGGKK